jgi:hypothetical protein
MLQNQKRLRATILALTLAVPAAWAQQKGDPRVDPPVKPYPPLNSGESSSKAPAEKNDAQDTTQTKPDTTPLTGAERFTLGSTGRTRSYLLPSFQFLEVGDTNPVNAVGQSSIRAASVITGRLSLVRVWSRYQFSTEYSGGGTFYNTTGGLNTSYQQLMLSQKISWRRWSLLLTDNFSYLPDSAYGVGGGLGFPVAYGPATIGASTGNLSNLNPGLVPSQSIYTGRARRFDNATLGEVQYQLSPRASVTVTGTYGFLHFIDPGYFNSREYLFQTGYNYSLTPKDTIGVIYGVTYFQYETGLNNFISHSARFAYGRRITGRLGLQVSAGPQINRFKLQTGGPGTSTSWNLVSSLRYQLRKLDLDLTYSRYTTGGGGVLFGSASDDIRAAATRRLSRLWTGSLTMGYSRNVALRQVVGPTTVTPLGYQAWYAGGTATRSLGRYASLLFNYNLQRQTNGSCVTGACAPTFLRHVFGVGVSWNFRPIGLD